MNLLEYQAKTLLRDCGAPIPDAWLVKSGSPVPHDIVFPVVAKSQVPVGGRGKAGGIVDVTRAEDLDEIVSRLLTLDIKGHRPRAVLLEAQVSSRRELYLSLRLNRDTRCIEWLASPLGGVEIESNAESVKTITDNDQAAKEIANTLGIQIETITPVIDAIRNCFLSNDLLLCEINPLIESEDGSLVCADAKCLVDDNARFRHPELPWPAETGNLPKPLGGTIGCIANGAGMAMSTMDTIVAAGGAPANFLDIGGGTGEKEFVAALKHIMQLPGVTSIIVNIFAGISRCDDIARGIIAARKQLPGLPPLFIRLEGTNRDIAVQMLTDAGTAIEPDLKTCVQKAMEIKP